jgi:hypothetical protein
VDIVHVLFSLARAAIAKSVSTRAAGFVDRVNEALIISSLASVPKTQVTDLNAADRPNGIDSYTSNFPDPGASSPRSAVMRVG